MEVQGAKPHAFIEDVMRNHRHQVPLDDSWFDQLPLAGRSISEYLEDDCRHAIAHIRRRPGKKRLDLDSWDEHLRFAISVEVVEALAEAYIRHGLGMSENLTLVRPRSGGFPRFADRATIEGTLRNRVSEPTAEAKSSRAYPRLESAIATVLLDRRCLSRAWTTGSSRGTAYERPIIPANVSLTAGSRLGPYEILAPLGAGGMGEVYRAGHAASADSAPLRSPLSFKALARSASRSGTPARVAACEAPPMRSKTPFRSGSPWT
jgi:hypothetical protein